MSTVNVTRPEATVTITVSESVARKLNYAIEHAPDAFHDNNRDLLQIGHDLDSIGLYSTGTEVAEDEEEASGGCGCGSVSNFEDDEGL